MDAMHELKLLIERPEDEIDLAQAALCIARLEYPELDVQAYLDRLNRLAADLSDQLPADSSSADRLLALNQFLFDEQGFSGNFDEYYDPRNSFLNEVLDRKLGIPITLSILYLEIGHRIGLPLEGVSFPGHFLVKLPVDGGDIVLDPFAGGVSLSEEDLENQLETLYGGQQQAALSLAPLLSSADKREILLRVLRNLKGIYLGGRRLQKALAVAEIILALAPDEPGEVRDRGMLFDQLECFRPALADYQHYLALDPEAQEAESIRARIIELRDAVEHLH